MLESILYAFLIIFVLIGLVFTINCILLRILLPKKKGKYLLIIPSDAKGSEVAGLVYSLYMRLNMFGELRSVKIALIDSGLSDEALEMCNMLCRYNSDIELYKIEELDNLINSQKIETSYLPNKSD